MVLRVSSTRVAGLAARDCVDEAPGQRGHPGEVAEEVEGGALGGEDRAQRAADLGHHGARRRPSTPSASCQSTTRSGSTWAKVSTAQRRPATTPGCRLTMATVPITVGGRRARRSGHPAGSTSSARARPTASTTAGGAGRRRPHRPPRLVRHLSIRSVVPARLEPGPATADPVRTATMSPVCTSRRRQPRRRLGKVAPGVGAPGLVAERGRSQQGTGAP